MIWARLIMTALFPPYHRRSEWWIRPAPGFRARIAIFRGFKWQISLHIGSHRPANYFTSKAVYHNSEIQPAFFGSDIGYIGQPRARPHSFENGLHETDTLETQRPPFRYRDRRIGA